jgi:poly(3-hydroxybutyrate) depolymerase
VNQSEIIRPTPANSRFSKFRPPRLAIHAGFALAVLAGNLSSGTAASVNDFVVFDYDMGNDAGARNGTGDLPGRLHVRNPSSGLRPLVVYFHGDGDQTSNGLDKQVTSSNIDNLLANAKSRDFFLYAPQSYASWNFQVVEKVMIMVNRAIRDYPIDPERIYVTGLSLGGRGSRCTLYHFTDMIAGVVPICSALGHGEDSSAGGYSHLLGKPVWAFHARNDTAVSVYESRKLVGGIARDTGLVPAPVFPSTSSTTNYYYENSFLRYTEYGTGGHSIWGTVFNTSAMYDWLLAQSHQSTPVQAGEKLLFAFGHINRPYMDKPPEPRNNEYWNITYTNQYNTIDAATVPWAITSDGERHTPANLQVAGVFEGSYNTGVTSGAPYHADIASDGWQTIVNRSETTNPGIIRITHLEPNSSYEVKIWGSDSTQDSTYNHITRYKIGNETRDLDTLNNVSTKAVFSSVAADSNGVIELKVFPSPGTNTRRGQINVLELVRIASTPPGDLSGAGLTGMDIGANSAGSGYVVSGGNWEVNGSGSGIGSTSDSFHYEAAEVSGDFRLVVRMHNVTSSAANARSGLMLRESNAAGAKMVYIAATTGTTVRWGARTTTSGTASESTAAGGYTFPNTWLMLERIGRVVRLAVSSDDINYTEVGSVTLGSLNATVKAGVFSSSGTVGVNALGVMSNYTCTLLPTAIATWRLDETSGVAAADTSGSHSGSLTWNTTWTSSGVIGGGAVFDGTKDSVEIPATTAFSGSTLTYALWFKPAPGALDGQPRGLISKRIGANNTQAFAAFIHTGNKIFVDVANGSGSTVLRHDTGIVPVANTWHHLAVVFDGNLSSNRLKVYLNGVLTYQANPSVTTILANSSPLSIGNLNYNYNTSFNGVIDQVRIFNQALSASEVDLLLDY